MVLKVYNEKGELYREKELAMLIQTNGKIYDAQGKEIVWEEKSSIFELIEERQGSDSFFQKTYFQKMLIILGGVLMNFLFAWGIFSFLFYVWVKPIAINTFMETSYPLRLLPNEEYAYTLGILEKHTGVYLRPLSWSIAEQSGIEENDLLLAINGTTIVSPKEAISIISRFPQQKLEFFIRRYAKECTSHSSCTKYTELVVEVTPWNDGKIGSFVIDNTQVNTGFTYKYGVIGSIIAWWQETIGHIVFTLQALEQLFTNIFFPSNEEVRKEALSQVWGPIRIIELMTHFRFENIAFIALFVALISINLGVFNLLPFPALDGGRALFIVIHFIVEKVIGIRSFVMYVFESYTHLVFFIIFIVLSFFIAYNDIYHIIYKSIYP